MMEKIVKALLYILVALVTTSPVSCTMYTKYKIAELVLHGTDPKVAMCALETVHTCPSQNRE